MTKNYIQDICCMLYSFQIAKGVGQMELLEFSPLSYNEPIYWLEQRWGRPLTDHEKHVVIMTYRWTRTTQEAEELKILEVLR